MKTHFTHLAHFVVATMLDLVETGVPYLDRSVCICTFILSIQHLIAME